MNKRYMVYLNGKWIDAVNQTFNKKEGNKAYREEYVRRSLINHDGYDPGIVVRERNTPSKNPAYKKSWGGYRGQLHENPARGFKTTKVETAGGVTWEWLNNLLGQKTAKRIAANTDAVRQADGSIAIILYSTKILIYKYSGEGASKPGEIELRLGGWNTATTRNRINALLPYGWRIFTKKGIPYVSNSYASVEVPPSDKITLNQTGAYV